MDKYLRFYTEKICVAILAALTPEVVSVGLLYVVHHSPYLRKAEARANEFSRLNFPPFSIIQKYSSG